ncbi:glycosyltransferase WbsX family protein [Maribellus maritimus]|uniref:glycosyltransferase WbsX family protein n=1 Tax=Maribellus maritimus TaxID=2870838 RepID=UPI001EEACB5C|nr:glycoside hydrolase family 99-like domain-containing protein [Maribellus maritimus]MCG6191328.1 glycoside hydrolase family 99-like domain-containing protein [Maribellus maritimus]
MSVHLYLLVYLLNFLSFNPVEEKNQTAVTPLKNYNVAAYVWPSCHHDERFGNMLWPEGIGEWEVIKKGNPRFDGHYQPRQPLWGYEMDNNPKVVEKWIDLAVDHGVNVFIYDWYWFDGGPFLESALNDGFLKAKNNSKMQFYIMWANHDVKRNYWNVHKFKDDTSLLWDGAVDWANFKIIVDRVINQYFKQPNYFKIDGKPVFSIFSIGNLLEGFGGNIEEARKALDYFRKEVVKAGFPGLHIQWNQGGGSIMSKEAATKFSERVNEMGFNSVAMYNMGGRNEDYLIYGSNSLKIRTQMDSLLNVPVFPCVSVGWDDTPRFPAKGIKDVVHYHNTPESFAALLTKAKEYLDSRPEQPQIITINAWNEWVEGSYLLPDMLNGYGYLDAVKKVINDKTDQSER